MKVKLFLIQELLKPPKINQFFNLHGRSLDDHVNAASRLSLEIQAYAIKKGTFL